VTERAPRAIQQPEASEPEAADSAPAPIVPAEQASDAENGAEPSIEAADTGPEEAELHSPHGIIQKGPTPQFIEVRFKGKRRDFYTAHVVPPVRLREYVVVEADRGQDLGVVTAAGELAKRKCEACENCNVKALPSQRVLRRAAPVDVERAIGLRDQEGPIRSDVRQMVVDHKLRMKISDAEWQWDRNKLIIYFTAEKRVDFRVLVRSLAKKYRTRIELKQIGVRDEAKRLDGVGRCGRELCSSNWLPELKPVTLQLAKDQNLSLNPSQISGACGRLMCSLRYEHDFYVQARKRFPKQGRQVRTSVGDESVESVNIFGNRVTLKGPSGELRTLTLEQLKRETAEARRTRKN
jgi:cell fate regulator YaaT (PSP1 superfamily)